MAHFTENDRDKILAFMEDHPFVSLIGNNGLKTAVTQVPVLIDASEEKVVLRGHIMRKTDHHLVFEKNNEVLVLFTGPQCYVSASWYNERGHGSTWNYITIHAQGKIKLLNEEATIKLLSDLTNYFEKNSMHPELLENMSNDYVRGNVKAIVAFEIEIDEIQPIFKLSQNQNDESYINIVSNLKSRSDYQSQEIANEMIQRRKNLFD